MVTGICPYNIKKHEDTQILGYLVAIIKAATYGKQLTNIETFLNSQITEGKLPIKKHISLTSNVFIFLL